jgi:hypothetical protein
MLQEQLFGVGYEVIACQAGCVELGEEGKCLASHRFLDQGGLAEPGPAEHFKQPVGLGLDAALASGSGAAVRSRPRVSRAASAGVGAIARIVWASRDSSRSRFAANASRIPG